MESPVKPTSACPRENKEEICNEHKRIRKQGPGAAPAASPDRRGEAEAETIRDAIKVFMGDSGEYRITWKHVTSTRMDTAAIKAALPEVAARFTRTTTTRRFCVA